MSKAAISSRAFPLEALRRNVKALVDERGFSSEVRNGVDYVIANVKGEQALIGLEMILKGVMPRCECDGK